MALRPFFGGVAYHLNDRTTLFAEYSTDTYDRDTAQGLIDISSPVNFGLQYGFRNGIDMKAYVVGGESIGELAITKVFNF